MRYGSKTLAEAAKAVVQTVLPRIVVESSQLTIAATSSWSSILRYVASRSGFEGAVRGSSWKAISSLDTPQTRRKVVFELTSLFGEAGGTPAVRSKGERRLIIVGCDYFKLSTQETADVLVRSSCHFFHSIV